MGDSRSCAAGGHCGFSQRTSHKELLCSLGEILQIKTSAEPGPQDHSSEANEPRSLPPSNQVLSQPFLSLRRPGRNSSGLVSHLRDRNHLPEFTSWLPDMRRTWHGRGSLADGVEMGARASSMQFRAFVLFLFFLFTLTFLVSIQRDGLCMVSLYACATDFVLDPPSPTALLSALS